MESTASTGQRLHEPEGLRLAVLRPSEIDASLREKMLGVLRISYDNVSQSQFDADLDEKEFVVIGILPGDGVAGFTTLRRIHAHIDGRAVTAFFSGDTVAHPEFRGHESTAGVQLLLRTIFDLVESDDSFHYWFIISSTFRSYRILSQLFIDYAPSRERDFTAGELQLVERLCELKGFDFDRYRSVVRFTNPSLPRLDPSDEARMHNDPAATFFHARNPHAGGGDRLASLVRLSTDNLTSLAKRLLAQ